MKQKKNQDTWSRYACLLEAEGLCCLEGSREGGLSGRSMLDHAGAKCTADDTLVITDDDCVALCCENQGIVCVGYCPPETRDYYFPHVQMVFESFEGMERQTLEQYFRRQKGLPVWIAATARLCIRESLPGDFEMLRRMEQEAGWRSDVTETEEKYLSYLKYAYSFYGYGYWTVTLRETGEIVGWCGFTEWVQENTDPDFVYGKMDHPVVRPEQPELELGYLVAKKHRGKGIALEMCRIVLAYGFETLDAARIWVRIENSNHASLRLAEKLGFNFFSRPAVRTAFAGDAPPDQDRRA